MRTKKVTRHFCDYCGKGSSTRPAMERHEAVCFRNPRRNCFLCENTSDVGELKKALYGSEGDLTKLREAAGSCPACILSAILQLVPKGKRVQGGDHWFEFDYKKEKEAWLDAERRQFAGAVGPIEF